MKKQGYWFMRRHLAATFAVISAIAVLSGCVAATELPEPVGIAVASVPESSSERLSASLSVWFYTGSDEDHDRFDHLIRRDGIWKQERFEVARGAVSLGFVRFFDGPVPDSLPVKPVSRSGRIVAFEPAEG